MIYHREDSIKAIKEAEQNAKVSAQSLKAIRFFAATSTTVTDAQAIEIPDIFPTWSEVLSSGGRLSRNTCITKDGVVYRVVTDVTPQESQPPDASGMLAVYRPIEQSHSGTASDPIPWVYGMDCLAGQYFSYQGHVYRVAYGGDMIPCVWAPGTAGLWQWELVS